MSKRAVPVFAILCVALVPALLAEWVFAVLHTEQLGYALSQALEVLWRCLAALPPLAAVGAACAEYSCKSRPRIALAALAGIAAYVLPVALFLVCLALSSMPGIISRLVLPIKAVLSIVTGTALVGGPALVGGMISHSVYRLAGHGLDILAWRSKAARGLPADGEHRGRSAASGDWVARGVGGVAGSVGMLSVFWYTNAADTWLAMVTHYLVPGAALSALCVWLILRRESSDPAGR